MVMSLKGEEEEEVNGVKREEMIGRGGIGRGEMSSASSVFGKKNFAFPFVAYRLHFKPSSTQGSA